MAQQLVNNGTVAGDGTGEVLFNAFEKVNENFTELYTRVKEVKITSTATELKNLLATPKDLIATAGSDKVIKLISVTGFLDYGTVDFDFTAALSIEYATSGETIFNSAVANFNQSADYYFKIDEFVNGGEVSVNDGVVLTTTVDATAGDSTVTLIILYTEQHFS
tara:strand:- start:2326 stop:2817 length:492 start_codon:yes stop_codon:yes gene_type:complete